MRKQFWIVALTAISLGAVSSAAASPLIRADHLAQAAVSDELVLAKYKPWHKAKHANRGHHYGWYRGKHKGWYNHKHH